MKLNSENLVVVTEEEILEALKNVEREESTINEAIEINIEMPAYNMTGKEFGHDDIYDVFENVDLLRDTVAEYLRDDASSISIAVAVASIKEAAIEVRQDGVNNVYILSDPFNACDPSNDHAWQAPAIMVSADENSISAYGAYFWDFEAWYNDKVKEYGDDFIVDDGGDWPWEEEGNFSAYTDTMFTDDDKEDVAGILEEADIPVSSKTTKKFYEFAKKGIMEGDVPFSDIDVDLAVESDLDSDWNNCDDYYPVSNKEKIEAVKDLREWIKKEIAENK